MPEVQVATEITRNLPEMSLEAKGQGPKKPQLIRMFILLANLILPLTVFYLALKFPQNRLGLLFAVFITAHVCVRMWETFFTSKEKDPRKFEGDWTLAVGTFAYIGLCFLITFEFFLIPRVRSILVIFLGSVLYGIASRLRWWGEITLGKQWAVHVVGKQKIQRVRLLQIGPYEFIRHPIYLGILLEEIALPLIANAYFSFVFAFLINIPLLLTRLFLEEKVSINKFGQVYQEYRQRTGLFVPKADPFNFLRKLFFNVVEEYQGESNAQRDL